MKRTRILLADDHVMFLDAMVSLLGQEFEVVGVARDGSGMLEMAASLQPDIVVADISMPQIGGIDAARMLHGKDNPPRILFLTMYADLPLVEEAFRAGGCGYVLKSGNTEELIKAIHCIVRGGTYVTPLLGDLISTWLKADPEQNHSASLTPRQREVLTLLAQGRTLKETGQVLNITTRTAESHKYEIMRNLGLKTTAELIRYALRINLV